MAERYVDYEPIPFYFLNDDFDAEEIIRQLDIMNGKGVKAYFLHVRDGILDEAYGTDLFFERVKFVVEESAKRGLKVWLYDEDSFPSGNAGGLIAIENPELAAYSLKVVKIKRNEIKNGVARRVLGNVRGLFGYAVATNESGEEKCRKISNCFGAVRRYWYRKDMDKTYYCDMQGKLFFPHVRAGTSYAEVMFEAAVNENEDVYAAYLEPVRTDSHYGVQADCLNKRTTEKFISRTHEKYAEYVGKYFGSVIPGIFLDEPSSGGILPYTDEVTAEFKKMFGYDVTDYYYKLSSEYVGDGRKERRDYIGAVSGLFRNNFIKPIAEWCDRHGIISTGHFYGEEDPLSGSLCAQSVYRQVKEMSLPGFDIIGRYVGDRNHCALILGAKIVVSSAVQSGKNRIIAECFALNPFNFGYDGLKKIGDWLFACGINALAPHAFHYGYGAYQRTDAGKSFFFQDALFDEYLRFSAYAGRVCKLLTEFKQNNKVLLVYPSGGFAEEVPFPMLNTGVFPSERARDMQNKCYAAVRYLIENQVQWDVADVQSISEKDIKDGKVIVGKCKYDKVIVVSGGETETGACTVLKNNGVNCLEFNGENLNGFLDCADIRGNSDDILAYEKTAGGERLLFLYQNNKNFAEISVPAKGNTVVYDAESDEYLKVDVADGYANLGIKGYGSVILIMGAESRMTVGDYYYSVCGDTVIECEENPQWTYMPDGAIGVITEYDILVEDGHKPTEFKHHKYARLRELIGTNDDIYADKYVIPYFDIAPREKRKYPVKAKYTAYITGKNGDEAILFDGGTFSGNYEIFWNGKRIEKDQIVFRRVYDIKNRCFLPKWNDGVNTMEIRFDNAEEFDGINGEIYLYKRSQK